MVKIFQRKLICSHHQGFQFKYHFWKHLKEINISEFGALKWAGGMDLYRTFSF